MDIQEAIDAPRIHHQWLPDRVYVEPHALSPDTLRILAGQGYDVGIDPDWPIWGEAAGILVGGRDLAEIEAGERRRATPAPSTAGRRRGRRRGTEAPETQSAPASGPGRSRVRSEVRPVSRAPRR